MGTLSNPELVVVVAEALVSQAKRKKPSPIPTSIDVSDPNQANEEFVRVIMRNVHDSLIELQNRNEEWLPECVLMIGDNYIAIFRVHQPENGDFGADRLIDYINCVSIQDGTLELSPTIRVLQEALQIALKNVSLEKFPSDQGVAMVDCTSFISPWGDLNELLNQSGESSFGKTGIIELYPGRWQNAVLVTDLQRAMTTSIPIAVNSSNVQARLTLY